MGLKDKLEQSRSGLNFAGRKPQDFGIFDPITNVSGEITIAANKSVYDLDGKTPTKTYRNNLPEAGVSF